MGYLERKTFIGNGEPKPSLLPYKLTFSQLPSRQNWTSSSWWFFILLPKLEHGYGPKQLMFVFASRSGKEIAVNKRWHKGIDLEREVNGVDNFQTCASHWHFDGETMYDELVFETGEATMIPNRSVEMWKEKQNGSKTVKHGGSIKMNDDGVFDVNYQGKNGGGKFKFWNLHESESTSPEVTDMGNRFYNYNLVAMRNANFKGEFTTPKGTENLEGIGYFQRVVMNLPMLPWLWNWTIFEDGSIYSYFVPYMGPHAIRRGNGFYNKILERFMVPISPVSSFHDGKTGKVTRFDKTVVIPDVDNGSEYPDFKVYSSNKEGDVVQFIARPNAHTKFLLERRVIKRFWKTRFVYNEYPIRAVNFKAKINGKQINSEQLGNGYGNCEYTWGMSL